MRLGRPTPILGADAGEILAEAGYSPEELAALVAEGCREITGNGRVRRQNNRVFPPLVGIPYTYRFR